MKVQRKFKFTVHVPLSHADAVRAAIAAVGGGLIGNYSHCSFSVVGEGRFQPLAGAQPHIGQAGQLEVVSEVSIEVSPIPQQLIKPVIAAMRAAHPYEETNYELIEIFRLEDLE